MCLNFYGSVVLSHFAIKVLVRSKLGSTENLYQRRVTNVIAALFKFMRCSEYLKVFFVDNDV